jgi:hypothetical protein
LAGVLETIDAILSHATICLNIQLESKSISNGQVDSHWQTMAQAAFDLRTPTTSSLLSGSGYGDGNDGPRWYLLMRLVRMGLPIDTNVLAEKYESPSPIVVTHKEDTGRHTTVIHKVNYTIVVFIITSAPLTELWYLGLPVV